MTPNGAVDTNSFEYGCCVLTHCFCQAECGLSVPEGEALNGLDERVTSLAFQHLVPFLSPLTSSTLVSMAFWCGLCVFVQFLPCLTSIEPLFQYDSKCQTELMSADWCLWEVVLYLLAKKELELEESSLKYCERVLIHSSWEEHVFRNKEKKLGHGFRIFSCPAKSPIC